VKHILLVALAIVCIVVLDVYALSKGINGVIMSLSVTAIAGLGGYEIRVVRDKLIKK